MSTFYSGAWRYAKGFHRVVWALLGLVLVTGIVLWFAVPIWTVNFMNQKLESLPDYRGHIEYVKINIWNASMDTFRVKLVKKGGEIPLPFFESTQIHISLEWSEILNGTFRSFITIYDPVINAVQGKTEQSSQFSTSRQLVEELKTLVPLKINRLDVVNGDVHFYDLREHPRVDLEMDDINVSAQNLTNSKGLATHFPSTVMITGRPLKKGKLMVDVHSNLQIKEPTFEQKVSIEAIPANALNSALSKYIRLDATTGSIEVFSEIKSEHGQFVGYVKPFFENMNFDPIPEDKDSPLALWSAFANVLKHAFENSHDIVATRVNLSGNFDDPHSDQIAAFLGVLDNAWFTALNKGLEPIGKDELEAARRFEPEKANSEGKEPTAEKTATPSSSNLPINTKNPSTKTAENSKLRSH